VPAGAGRSDPATAGIVRDKALVGTWTANIGNIGTFDVAKR